MAKDYFYMRSQLFDTPLWIAKLKLDDIFAVVGPRLNLANVNAETFTTRSGGNLSEVEVETSIRIINVHGTLVNRFSSAESGMTSFDRLADSIMAAVDNSAVDALVLDIDSFGGAAAGCFDLAALIRQLAEQKPIFALVNTHALSAAYAIASAASKIFMTADSLLGSVGVVATHVDETARDEIAGDKVIHVFAGARKVDFSPHIPVQDEALEWLQASVNESYDKFVSLVAEYRGLPERTVREHEAAIFRGRTAINAGLADEIMPARDAIQTILQEVREMKTQTDQPTAASDEINTDAETEQPEITATLEVTETDSNVISLEQSQQAVKKAQADAASISELCTRMKRPDLAKAYINEGLNLEQAKAKLFDQLAGDEPVIDNTVGDPSQTEAGVEGKNLLVSAMQRLNEKRGKSR